MFREIQSLLVGWSDMPSIRFLFGRLKKDSSCLKWGSPR